MTTTCVHLKERFGSRYRVRKEAAGVTWYVTLEAERLWLLELPCRYGVVYPQGGDVLAATITSRRIGHRVAALSCIRSSRGDVERVVTFSVDDAEAVLAILKPRRRRLVSEAERVRLRAMGEAHRFHGCDEAENGAKIDAVAGSDLGPVHDAADAGHSHELPVTVVATGVRRRAGRQGHR